MRGRATVDDASGIHYVDVIRKIEYKRRESPMAEAEMLPYPAADIVDAAAGPAIGSCCGWSWGRGSGASTWKYIG